MFGNCLWFQIDENNEINKLITNFYNKFGTQKYIGHFTMDYNIRTLKNINNYIVGDFFKINTIYETVKNGFYSLQQDYLFCNDNNKIFHISLAYKLTEKFTEEEKNFFVNVNIPDVIKKEDLEINLWNCNSIMTDNWYKINKY